MSSYGVRLIVVTIRLTNGNNEKNNRNYVVIITLREHITIVILVYEVSLYNTEMT